MDDFYQKIAEILEVDAVNASDVLADFPEWDSLSVLSAIAMIGKDYGVNLMANTSILAIALPLAPVTILYRPGASRTGRRAPRQVVEWMPSSTLWSLGPLRGSGAARLYDFPENAA